MSLYLFRLKGNFLITGSLQETITDYGTSKCPLDYTGWHGLRTM